MDTFKTATMTLIAEFGIKWLLNLHLILNSDFVCRPHSCCICTSRSIYLTHLIYPPLCCRHPLFLRLYRHHHRPLFWLSGGLNSFLLWIHVSMKTSYRCMLKFDQQRDVTEEGRGVIGRTWRGEWKQLLDHLVSFWGSKGWSENITIDDIIK